ncbi:hypothetical protein [Poritiphilus flavus]|uniref:Uncharacterized protein n=1 Tax=Poritiphilus flavus TaxID=2697053 RepID=A0A6L9EGQ3_9FLAO|nr:hypothetical protein [Poritiphilus flavus]NAS13863.1 hypothetical protein [Poritiphilus flavus]
MKRIYLLVLLPFLVSFQCEDDLDNSGFETTYLLQNESGIDLILLSNGNSLVDLESQSEVSIGSTLNSVTEPVVPSESLIFEDIKLYRTDGDDFILVYDQEPLDDALWIFNEPSVNRYEYTLVITDDLID